MFLRSLFCTCLFLLWSGGDLTAQLDTIHWLPPMYPGTSFVSPFLDLTTPEAQAFPVSIRDGSGNLVATVMVSNTNPVRYNLNTAYAKVLIPQPALHKVFPAAHKGRAAVQAEVAVGEAGMLVAMVAA